MEPRTGTDASMKIKILSPTGNQNPVLEVPDSHLDPETLYIDGIRGFRQTYSRLSYTDRHCVRSDPELPRVVQLLLRPAVDGDLHGVVPWVYQSQQRNVGVNAVKLAQIQRVGVLQ